MAEAELIKIMDKIFHEDFSAGFPDKISLKLKGIPSFRLVYLKGGTFIMGDDNSPYTEKKPAHKVKLDPFYMAEFPVTQNLFEAVTGNNPSSFKGARKPVEQVNWFDAVDFCNALNERAGLKKAYEKKGK